MVLGKGFSPIHSPASLRRERCGASSGKPRAIKVNDPRSCPWPWPSGHRTRRSGPVSPPPNSAGSPALALGRPAPAQAQPAVPRHHFSLPRSALCEARGERREARGDAETQRHRCSLTRRGQGEDHGPGQAHAVVQRQPHPDGHLSGTARRVNCASLWSLSALCSGSPGPRR